MILVRMGEECNEVSLNNFIVTLLYKLVGIHEIPTVEFENGVAENECTSIRIQLGA